MLEGHDEFYNDEGVMLEGDDEFYNDEGVMLEGDDENLIYHVQ